jgi:hypothetical protein
METEGEHARRDPPARDLREESVRSDVSEKDFWFGVIGISAIAIIAIAFAIFSNI